MEMFWTSERIELLSSLWAEGLSTAEIGRRLGVTKNAVVGKAHRLQLTPRPSPLKRTAPKPAAPTVVHRIAEFTGPTCSWPHGHPGEKGFHFCGAKALPTKPYCSEHAALAYVRPKGSNAA
jgi:GcrA cell cycle regulator